MRCGRQKSLVPRSSSRRCSSVGRLTSGRPQYDGCARQTDGAAHFGQCRRNEQPCHSKKVHHLLLLASSLTAAAPAYHRERTLLPKVSMIPVLAQPASAVEMTTPTMPGEVASLWINHRSPCSAPHGSQALQRPIAIGATTHAIAAPNMNSGTSAVKRTRSSCSRAMSIASLT